MEWKRSAPSNTRGFSEVVDQALVLLRAGEELMAEHVHIAVLEALSNVRRYAHAHNPALPIFLHVRLTEREIEIIVMNCGGRWRKFERERLDHPDPQQELLDNLEATSGRGLLLIQLCTDYAEFRDYGRVLVMRFFRNGVSKDAAL